MIQRLVLNVLCILALAVPHACGRDTIGAELPEGVLLAATVASPVEFIQAADRFVVNATEGTQSSLPPGLVTMLTGMYMPIPFEIWQSAEPAHLVVMPDARREDYCFVGVFQVQEYQAFLNGLLENDWILGEPDEDEAAHNLQPVLTPNGQTQVFMDLADGFVAVSDRPDALFYLFSEKNWRPVVDSEADITLVMPLRSDSSNLIGEWNTMFAEKKESFLKGLGDLRLSDSFRTGLTAVIEKYAPEMIAILADARGGMIEVRVEDQALLIDATGEFRDGSLLREVAVQAEKNGDIDTTVAERFAGNAISVGIATSMETIIPNARERIARVNTEYTTTMFPALADTIQAVNEKFWDAGVGRATMAGFMHESRQSSFTLYEAANPALLMEACTEAMSFLDDMLREATDDPDLRVRVIGGPVADGREFHEYRFEIANRKMLEQWLQRIFTLGDPQLADMYPVRVNPDFRLFLAEAGDGVVMAAGPLTADEFASRLDDMKAGPAQPYIGLPPVQSVMATLIPRQIFASVLDAGGLYLMMTVQNAFAFDALLRADQPNPVRLALPRFSQEYIRNGSCFGFSLGGADGLLIGRLMMPATGINTLLKNHDLLTRIQQEELYRYINTLKPDTDEDGSVDEDGPDGDNLDESELDEDPDAA